MAVLFGLLILGLIAYVISKAVPKSLFIIGCGLSLILVAPILANTVDPGILVSDIWLSTFRLLGLCLFIWGPVEKVIEVFRPTGNSTS